MAKKVITPETEQIEIAKPFQRPALHLTNGEISDDALLYSFDIGTGTLLGLTSVYRKMISLEPVLAPLTDRKDIQFKSDAATKPEFSLRDGDERTTYVFGVKDVTDHGKYSLRRRLTSLDRYTSADYARFFKVMLFQAFKKYAGNSDWIRPTGAISVPVAIYNDDETMAQIRDALIGKHEITDASGSTLRVEVTENRFIIVAEGYGARRYREFDPSTLERRTGIQPAGAAIVADIGYETINESLFHGLKYIRDASYTLERGGFGIVVRAIQNWASTQLKGVDVSRIDIALRRAAGIPLGEPKFIEIAPGVTIDVQPVYDVEVPLLAERAGQDIATRFADQAANVVLLAGGTAYHLAQFMNEAQVGWPVEVVPDPEVANCMGVMIRLYQEVLSRK